jgi:hypothetical protein
MFIYLFRKYTWVNFGVYSGSTDGLTLLFIQVAGEPQPEPFVMNGDTMAEQEG